MAPAALAGAVDDMTARPRRARHHAGGLPGRGAVRHRRRARGDRRRRAARAVRARDRARPRWNAHRAARSRGRADVPAAEHDAVSSSPRFPARPRSTVSVAAHRWRGEALVQLLLAIGGVDGLAAGLGDELSELECNPVLVTATDAIALDARLVLRDAPSAAEPPPATDFTALFAPRGCSGRRVDHALDLRQPVARRVPQRRLGRPPVRAAPGRGCRRRRARVRRRRRHAGADRLPARRRARGRGAPTSSAHCGTPSRSST